MDEILFRIPKPARAHHGDCVGADAEFHQYCLGRNVAITIHPPSKDEFRAYCRRSADVFIFPPKAYCERNRDIVNDTDCLIAAPTGQEQAQFGGTWFTVHYAMKMGKPVTIIWPDGSIEQRNANQPSS